MTAETDLLPLPEKSEIDRHLPTGVRVYGYTADDMKTYASACVSSATAEKDAEIDALRTRLEDTVRDSTNKIEALRAEVERVNSWNERVSVCRDHVADIVDGPCVICALDAAEARAERLSDALREAADDLERGIDARIVVAQLRARADLLHDQEEGHEQ